MLAAKKPLEESEVEVIHKDLDWSEFQWGEKSLIVKGIRYEELQNFKFYPIKT